MFRCHYYHMADYFGYNDEDPLWGDERDEEELVESLCCWCNPCTTYRKSVKEQLYSIDYVANRVDEFNADIITPGTYIILELKGTFIPATVVRQLNECVRWAGTHEVVFPKGVKFENYTGLFVHLFGPKSVRFFVVYSNK